MMTILRCIQILAKIAKWSNSLEIVMDNLQGLLNQIFRINILHTAFTCSKLTTETLEKSVKYDRSQEQRHQNDVTFRNFDWT